MRRSLVRSTERPTKAAMWVERRKRNRARWRTISTSSSVRRKAGGSDARRNRGLLVCLSAAAPFMRQLYQTSAATSPGLAVAGRATSGLVAIDLADWGRLYGGLRCVVPSLQAAQIIGGALRMRGGGE